MFTKKRKIIWFLAIFFLFSQIPMAGLAFARTGAGNTGRIAGEDRYQTAVAISQKGWETAEYAVLARGDSFADALCAGPLAQKYGGPILLTAPNQLNGNTLQELQRLGVKHIFIAGGPGAVSPGIEEKLKAGGINSIERVYGSDRYETSVKIAEKVGGSGQAVLATGGDFPDALSISGIAAGLQMPILLTAKDKLSSSVNNYIQANNFTQTYIVGGTGVISPEIETILPSPFRLAGQDRYGTNVAVMRHFADELDYQNIYVAIGTNFADALTGAVLAAQTSSPLVLTAQSLPQGTADYLQAKLKLSSLVLGLGGGSVVPSGVLNGLGAAKEQIPVEEKYSTAGNYGPETGTKTIAGSVIISAPGVTLRNTVIEGDLLLGQSIGDGSVELRDVTVKGRTIINGGGPNSIIMYNFNGQSVIVDVPDSSSVRLVAQGNTTINNVSMEGNGRLEESALTGQGFITVEIPAGAEVTLNGEFHEVNIEAGGASVTVAGGGIATMNISATAAGAGINLANGTTVTTLNANAQSSVTGQGQIISANINANGVSLAQTPGTTTVASGVTADIGGSQQSGTSGSSANGSGSARNGDSGDSGGSSGNDGGSGGDNTVEAKATITAGTVSGVKGTKVDATISLADVANILSIQGIAGISGGEFELVYNAAVADVANGADINNGSLVNTAQAEWSSEKNPKYTPNSLKYAFASTGNELISQDGTLIEVSFSLIKEGTVELVIKDLILKDQSAETIPTSLLNAVEGQITVNLP